MKIEKVIFLDEYIIEIMFNTNCSYFYDFKPQLTNFKFHKLRSMDAFMRGHLEDGCRIVWEDDMKLEDYEIFGFEIYESSLYTSSEDKYVMLCGEAQ